MYNSVFVSRIKAGNSFLDDLIRSGDIPKAIFTLKEQYKEAISDFGRFNDQGLKTGIPVYFLDDYQHCEKLGISRAEGTFLRSLLTKTVLESKNPDIGWLLGWGEILSQDVLNIPKIGWIGSHPTLLPKYRGGAPLVWPVVKGHNKTGVTLMWLDKGVDTGDILDQDEFSIGLNDNAQSLYEKMINSYGAMLRRVVKNLNRGEIKRIPQNKEEFVEEWRTRTPEDSRLVFDIIGDNTGRTVTKYLHDQIRAVDGLYPSAFIDIETKQDYERVVRYIGIDFSFDEILGERISFNNSIYDPETDKMKVNSRISEK